MKSTELLSLYLDWYSDFASPCCELLQQINYWKAVEYQQKADVAIARRSSGDCTGCKRRKSCKLDHTDAEASDSHSGFVACKKSWRGSVQTIREGGPDLAELFRQCPHFCGRALLGAYPWYPEDSSLPNIDLKNISGMYLMSFNSLQDSVFRQ
jgi:hypothetical protein